MNYDENEIKREALRLLKADEIDAYIALMEKHPKLYAEGERLAELYTSQLSTVAVAKDSLKLIEFYVRNGADVNGGNSGAVPIIEACLGGKCRPNSIRKLIELGANVNSDKRYGEMQCEALNLAISESSVETVKLLLENGAILDVILSQMSPLDRAVKVGDPEIIELLKSAGAKTAIELGFVPPSSTEAVVEALEYRFMESPESTIQGAPEDHLRIDVHVVEALRDYALCTGGMSEAPLPVDSDAQEMRWPELLLRIPVSWPRGNELLDDAEYSWPLMWIRRIAFEAHKRNLNMGKLFFWPNGSPPKPFSAKTKMCYWMLMAGIEDPIFVSDEKTIGVYTMIPIFQEEYDLVQSSGIGALGEKFDAHEIGLMQQMLDRPNVAL